MPNVTPLKLAIVATGRTQRDIAASVGIDEFKLSRLVNGREHADEDLKEKLAQELGRDDLFGDDELAA